jgi:HlyD family secretion protein
MIHSNQSTDTLLPAKPFWNRKATHWGLALLLLASLTWFAGAPLLRNRAMAVQRSSLNLAVVERGPFRHEFAVDGQVVSSHYPTVYAPAAGRITLLVQSGQPVNQGDLLATIDNPERRSELNQEKALLQALEAQTLQTGLETRSKALQLQQLAEMKALGKASADRELKRFEQLMENGLTNQRDLDKARDELTVAILEADHAQETFALAETTHAMELTQKQQEVKRQKLVVAEAERKVEELQLRAPVTGTVGTLSIDPADLVSPSAPVMSVIDRSHFAIEIQIPERMASEIPLDCAARIHFQRQEYAGRLEALSPEVSGAAVRGLVAFSSTYPPDLRQNQRVHVRLLIREIEDTLKVARGPFLEDGLGRVAYQLRGEQLERVAIEVGASSPTEVEIVRGLSAGDQIVISDTSRFQQRPRLPIQ